MQKQNKAGRIALMLATILLCATLITTSALSTTLAKYTTTDGVGSVSARVAKWGLALSNSSDTDTSWTVSENSNSITAASSGSTDKIIAPGTSGYLVCFKLTGNPEVLHNVTMEYNVTIPDGYKKLIGQEDYFPILITVGRATYDESDNVTARKEIHYYVESAGSLDTLIGQVASKTFSENIAPNGWSGSKFAEYYVRWDWFYNADDVPSYIPDNVKNALTAYQSTGNDTLLAEAMVQQLGKNEVDGKIATLTTALETAKTKLNGTPNAADIQNLENALADYLGVSPRSHATGEQIKTTNVNWYQLYHQGAMEIYDNDRDTDDYERFFNVFANSDRIYSDRKASTNRDLCYFTTLESSFPLTTSTYYEMTFNAANLTDCQYAGVVFAAKAPQNLESSTDKKVWRKPYFFYGGLGGESKINDTYSNTNYACIDIDYCTYVNEDIIARTHKNVGFTTITDTEMSTTKKYGQYKVVYNGLNITCYYKDTYGSYISIDSFTIDDSAPTLAVGVESRNGTYGSQQRTMILRDVVITERTNITEESVMQSLINEVQAIIDAQVTDRNFTISANADITITQIKSSIVDSKYDALTSQITSATSTYKNENASDADRTKAITDLEAALAAYLGIPARTFGYTTNETMTIDWQDMINRGLMSSTLNNYSDNYTITSSAGENSYINLTANTTNSDDVEMFYLMDHNMDNTTYPITEDTYYVYDFYARNLLARKQTTHSNTNAYGGVVFAYGDNTPYTLYGCFYGNNYSSKLGVYKGYFANRVTLIEDDAQRVQLNQFGTENYGKYRIIYEGLKVTVQYKSKNTEQYTSLGEFELPGESYITLGAMVHPSAYEHSLIIRDCKLTKPPTLSPQTVLWDLIEEAKAVING